MSRTSSGTGSSSTLSLTRVRRPSVSNEISCTGSTPTYSGLKIPGLGQAYQVVQGRVAISVCYGGDDKNTAIHRIPAFPPLPLVLSMDYEVFLVSRIRAAARQRQTAWEMMVLCKAARLARSRGAHVAHNNVRRLWCHPAPASGASRLGRGPQTTLSYCCHMLPLFFLDLVYGLFSYGTRRALIVGPRR